MQKALISILVAAGTVLAFVPSAVLAQTPPDAEPYTWGPHMMWWAMIFGPLFMILFLAVLIAAVILLVRWVGGGPWQTTVPLHLTPPGRTPLDVLKGRFARGEIDKEEFEERRSALGE